MTRARDLARVINPTNFTVDNTNSRIGLGSTAPTAKLNVAGIISATQFFGDGSNLEGVASAGLGTALADEGANAVIYYTDKVLGVEANTTVDVPDASSSNVAYTQYEEVSVSSGVDFIIADGDDFVPDILGISSDVQTPGLLSGGGGRVRADNYTDKAGTGAPTFNAGLNVVGLVSATSFSGDGTGLTGVASTDNIITGTAATFTGGINANSINVTGLSTFVGFVAFTTSISVGGTITYEDVTNVDSVGLITARSGIEFGTSGVGGTITAAGQAEFTGVVTATSFHGDGSNLTGIAVGLNTEAGTASGIVTHVRLSSAQDHKITATGFTTITSSGSGTEGESHTIRIINSGIATVGFSTYFLFPSGSAPSLPTADGAISLISFTVHDSVGAGCTQLLAGASVNYS
tara:strand:+ start:4402 stop:5616 length:1215 start_codon:yes stop_codon:yes gene_type:complete